MWKVTIVALLAIVAGTYGFKHVGTRGPRWRPLAPETHIVGGESAESGQFPHHVAMHIGVGDQRLLTCGGSILSENWILTAAHCVVEPLPDPYWRVIVAGDYNLVLYEGFEQERNITRTTVHELYPNTGTDPYDIALCFLAHPLIFNQNVMPIKLPIANSIPSGDATLSGWGTIDSTYKPIVLQTAVMPIVDFAQCFLAYGNNMVDITMVCTGPMSGGLSACSGDSGSPLIQYDGANMTDPTVIGIVSWGTIPCGTPNAPSVYTRVSAYIAWIADNMV